MSDLPNAEHASTVKQAFRMYTQHNFFFGMSVLPIAALVLYVVPTPPSWSDGEGFLSTNVFLMLIALAGPLMGVFFFGKEGPLVIDPESETLTYKRHVFPFSQLGLVRTGSMQSMLPTGGSIESGNPGERSKVTVGVVRSGDFMLSPDDQLPKRRLEKLANHLNAVLADYYQRRGEPLGPRQDNVT